MLTLLSFACAKVLNCALCLDGKVWLLSLEDEKEQPSKVLKDGEGGKVSPKQPNKC